MQTSISVWHGFSFGLHSLLDPRAVPYPPYLALIPNHFDRLVHFLQNVLNKTFGFSVVADTSCDFQFVLVESFTSTCRWSGPVGEAASAVNSAN